MAASLRRALALGALVMAGCPAAGGGGRPVPDAPKASTSSDPADKDYLAKALPRATLALQDAFGGKHRVEVEVAATPAARQRGLMWREQLAKGQGMLFIFPEEEEHSFWMRNTLIPLDLIFIGKDARVVGIVERAQPKTLTSRGVPAAALYVLEVPGGWSEAIGLKVGSPVDLQGTSMIEVVP